MEGREAKVPAHAWARQQPSDETGDRPGSPFFHQLPNGLDLPLTWTPEVSAHLISLLISSPLFFTNTSNKLSVAMLVLGRVTICPG